MDSFQKITETLGVDTSTAGKSKQQEDLQVMRHTWRALPTLPLWCNRGISPSEMGKWSKKMIAASSPAGTSWLVGHDRKDPNIYWLELLFWKLSIPKVLIENIIPIQSISSHCALTITHKNWKLRQSPLGAILTPSHLLYTYLKQ